ncbi:MAG: beta-N-acetylhexosaminidase [Lachnospiraceae bacterium]|nr:beta-N-acetylhexosaminidase [Lachnospiraceae bacterium]
MNDEEILNLSPEEKRELRHQRKIKNLICAYIGLAVVLIALVLGVFFGVRFLTKLLNGREEADVNISTEEASQFIEEEEYIPEETQVEEEPDAEALLDEIIAARISEMTLEEKVAGLFIVRPEDITGVSTAVQAGEGTKTALGKYPVGGIIYFKSNIKSQEQITEMLANTETYSRFPIFLAVDEEGGEVSRVADALGLANVGSMADIGSSGDSNQAYEAMKIVGTYLDSYGFNLDFAPVADVLTNSENKSIGTRSFGNDANLVADMVVASVNGLNDTGITACIKHFPGIGSASEDTHNGLVVVDRSLEQLQQEELIPFIRAIEAEVPMIMVGHISLPQIVGDNTPASMSEVVISDLLRAQLGFNGVVITDAMNMEAITEYYGSDEAAVMALKAGADMILMPEDYELAAEGVVLAVQEGTISEERINDSLTRIYRIKFADAVAAE